MIITIDLEPIYNSSNKILLYYVNQLIYVLQHKCTNVQQIICLKNNTDYLNVKKTTYYIHFGKINKKIKFNKNIFIVDYIPPKKPLYKLYAWCIWKKFNTLVNNADYIFVTKKKVQIAFTYLYENKKNNAYYFLMQFEKKTNELWVNKEIIKNQYTDGFPFFITNFILNENEFKHILKSFSIFKKWQLSNMKLVVFIPISIISKINAVLNGYKFKNEVIILSDEDVFLKLLPHSFCLICVKNDTIYDCIIDIAIFNKIPIIYADNNEELSKNMLLMYKEETLTNQLSTDKLEDYFNQTEKELILFNQIFN